MKYLALALVLSSFLSIGNGLPLKTVSSSAYLSSTAILTPLSGLGEGIENAIGSVVKSKTLTPGFPDSGRTMAILERKSLESLPIQLDEKYGHLQQFAAHFTNPRPIVDTIQEYEKYGNDGEQHRKVATAFIGGVEGLSNALNTAVELPFTLPRQVGKGAVTSLNTVGGKLVGLY